ncbi:unnamed protein product [Effrenium voratum]|nr:unnamed protein product [Effrenium voratum]
MAKQIGPPLCRWGAGCFLPSQCAKQLSCASKALKCAFDQGEVGLHICLRTHQLSWLDKSRREREEILVEVVVALKRLPKSPLLSLRLEEPKCLRELYPLVLEVLRLSPNLEILELQDIAVDPIRASHAAGCWHSEQAAALVQLHDSGGFRRLRHLTLTAGDFDCQGLSALFEIAAGVRSLRLRGKAPPLPWLAVPALLSLPYFSWTGSNIRHAVELEALCAALPRAHLHFRGESSGGWAGPFGVHALQRMPRD